MILADLQLSISQVDGQDGSVLMYTSPKATDWFHISKHHDPEELISLWQNPPCYGGVVPCPQLEAIYFMRTECKCADTWIFLFWFHVVFRKMFIKYQLHYSSSQTWPRSSCSRTSWGCHSRLCRNIHQWSPLPWKFITVLEECYF